MGGSRNQSNKCWLLRWPNRIKFWKHIDIDVYFDNYEILLLRICLRPWLRDRLEFVDIVGKWGARDVLKCRYVSSIYVASYWVIKKSRTPTWNGQPAISARAARFSARICVHSCSNPYKAINCNVYNCGSTQFRWCIQSIATRLADSKAFFCCGHRVLQHSN